MTRDQFVDINPPLYRGYYDANTGGFPVQGFVSTWKTDNAGASSNTQVKLPLIGGGTYNFEVDWGDGNSDTITVFDQAETTHTYSASGTFTITITGTIIGFRFGGAGDLLKLLNISSFGPLRLGVNGSNFSDCANLTITATDPLDLTGGTSIANAFARCVKLTSIPSIKQWDFSLLTTLRLTFVGCSTLNQDFSGIDVSNVTDMTSTFSQCALLDQDFSSWDVSAATMMNSMFNSSALSTPNYDAMLIAWSALTLQNSVAFGASSTQFSAGAAADARSDIISNFSWTITDGGQAP